MTDTTGSSRLRLRCRSHCSSRIRRSGSPRAIPAVSTGRWDRREHPVYAAVAPAAEVAVLGEKFRKAVADHPELARPALHDAAPDLCLRSPDEWEIAVRHSVDYGRTFENLMQNIGTVTDGFPNRCPTRPSPTAQTTTPEHPR